MAEGEAAPKRTRAQRIIGGLRAGRQELSDAWGVIEVLRAPAIGASIGFFALSTPGQTLEIYRLFSEDFRFAEGFSEPNVRFGLFFVLLLVASYVIWYISRVLTLTTQSVHAVLHKPGAAGATARWAPRIFGAAPSLGAALGLFLAADPSDPETRGLYGAAALAALLGVFRLWSSWRRSTADPTIYDDLRRSWLRLDVRLALGAIFVAIVGYLLTSPIEFTQRVGALSILLLFLMALVFGMAHLTYVYDRYAIPALTLLVGGAFLWSYLDWNDNHYVRLIEREEVSEFAEPQLGALDVETAFNTWLLSRQNRAAYGDDPYPVYIVAAQGGGLYAAYQAAVFLARIQDECPTFAQHVFAISGVSGGAVGATVFTALAKEFAENQPISNPGLRPCNEFAPEQSPEVTDKAQEILAQDFLSPLLNAMLFPDFTARFSPVAIPSFDRARALERAFEQAWPVEEGRQNPLREGILTYWNPLGAAPLLLINTTEVETGRRLIISPIQDLGGDLRSYAQVVARGASDSPPDMRLSTAMVNSARFPYVTPAGSIDVIRRTEDRGAILTKTRLVDGGYFENSGIDTALDLVRRLRDAQRARAQEARRRAVERGEELSRREARRRERNRVDIRLIVFDLTEDRYRAPSHALGEALSPIKAILNARTSRAELAQGRARRTLRADDCRYLRVGGVRTPGGAPDCLASFLRDDRVWSVSLNDYESDFQLGWILSKNTFQRIDRQLGAPELCDNFRGRLSELENQIEGRFGAAPVGGEIGAFPEDAAVLKHNSCVAQFIVDQLRRR